MVRDEFDEHMRRLREGFRTDLSIKCINGSINCHKFVLASRNPYFASKFRGKWSKKKQIVCKGNNSGHRNDLNTHSQYLWMFWKSSLILYILECALFRSQFLKIFLKSQNSWKCRNLSASSSMKWKFLQNGDSSNPTSKRRWRVKI